MKKMYLLLLISSLILQFGCSESNSAKDNTIKPNDFSVQIGSQVWMKKNLDVSRYQNGDPINFFSNPAEFKKQTTGACCYYDNDSAKGAVYGMLYNWYAVNDPRGLAPAGWHVPSDGEWAALVAYLRGVTVAGDKMKEPGSVHWLDPHSPATNESGFTALPGGCLAFYNQFTELGNYACWWTSTPSNVEQNSYYYRIIAYYSGISQNKDQNRSGYSVRCIKN